MERILTFIAVMVFIQTILMLLPPVAVYYVAQTDTAKSVSIQAKSLLNNTNSLMHKANNKIMPKADKLINRGVQLGSKMNRKMSVVDDLKKFLESLKDPLHEVTRMLHKDVPAISHLGTSILAKLNSSNIRDTIFNLDMIATQMKEVFGKENVNLTRHVLHDADDTLDKMNRVFSKLA